jgi:hypothetical protein
MIGYRLALFLACAIFGCTLPDRPVVCARDADCLNGRRCIERTCRDPSPRNEVGVVPSAVASSSEHFTLLRRTTPRSRDVRSSARYRLLPAQARMTGSSRAAVR